MSKVLLIEDNEVMQLLAKTALKEISLSVAGSLQEAQSLMQSDVFDLILLDIGLPDGDGLTFLSHMNEASYAQTPVIIITGKNDITSKVSAFSSGAEDFITKPFDPVELKARVLAKLKKIEQLKNQTDLIRIGDLKIIPSKQRVILEQADKQTALDITTLEFKLLLALAKQPESVYTREKLLSDVWGDDLTVTTRSVDTHIAHLRKKILKSRVKIDTVVRSGYRLLIK